jgi:RNA polymerase sigma-70 factor (ECF subfamily)
MSATGESETDILLQRASRGDRSATDELLARHRPRLKRMVSLRMDPRLRARVDPSDVVQDALLCASRMLADYLRDRPLPYYPWLRQLAWQRLHDLHVRHLHAKKRSVTREDQEHMALPDDSVMQLAEQVAGAGTSPSGNALRKELRLRVREALDQMKPAERELLALRYLEQLTAKEIAAILGIREDAVNMRHVRALRRLRGLLGHTLGDP